ncbi:HD domain-containing protein [Kordia antarctica]|uniref:HD domain-containing protein n=1 Tax=Kordia antarctica TaxID=1218801 RepID=UPI00135771B7|nr:HD domain-containing protein [Kordia antarctica]
MKKHCFDLLTHSRCKVLPFHSMQHTLEVYKNVQTIGKNENLNTEELEILKIAALFHDTGISIIYKGHEAISSKNAQIFLSYIEYPDKNIAQVMNCINATKMPQQPITKLERIICDADLLHLSSKNYMLKNELLRMEWKTHMDLIFTDEDWLNLNLNFLTGHKYHTEYGKNILEEKKEKNIKLMEKLKAEAKYKAISEKNK